MGLGEFFYKCSPKTGVVQFIYARVDPLLREIQYYSRKRLIKRIPFCWITDLKFGIHNDAIRETLKNRFTDTSLVIYYKNEDSVLSSFLNINQELHLTFRTERQFDLWGTGLKAIYNKSSSSEMSKKNLLWHCRLFKRFFSNQDFQLIDTFFNNSTVYNEHVNQTFTYEATVLDRRIPFCFEKQEDDLNSLTRIFFKSEKKQDLSDDFDVNIINIIFKNVSTNAKTLVYQLHKMKEIINNL